MRVLVVHSPLFRARWRALGHDVLAWGPHADCDLHPAAPATPLGEVLAALPAGWTPDAIVFGDDCRLLRVLGLEDAPCPTVMVSIDAHHNVGWHAPFASAFDAAGTAQKDYLPSFDAAGAPGTHWLPCWAPDDLPPPAAEKTHAVAFVGTLDPRLHPERARLLDALRPRLPLHVAEGAYAPVFTRSRLVLNQTVKGDLNARVFEAMACGAMLLTERVDNGLLDLFTENEHLATYPRGDVDAIVAAAERWLGAEAARARVAEAGRAAVRAAHLESHRAATVLGWVPGAVRRAAAVRFAGAARAYCQLAYIAKRLAATFRDATFYPPVAAAYRAAAAALAARAEMEEPDRRAVRGLLALEDGEYRQATEHLAWAAEHGGRVEDRVACIEALLRAGDVRGARDVAAALGEGEAERLVADGIGLLADDEQGGG